MTQGANVYGPVIWDEHTNTATAVQRDDLLGKWISLGSPRTCTLFVGTENVPVVLVVVWFSSMTTPDRTRHSRLRTSTNGGNGETSPTQSELAHSDFSLFPAMKPHLPGHGSRAMRTSNMLPSRGYVRSTCSMCPGWTNLSYTVTSASSWKSSVPVTPSWCIFSFLS